MLNQLLAENASSGHACECNESMSTLQLHPSSAKAKCKASPVSAPTTSLESSLTLCLFPATSVSSSSQRQGPYFDSFASEPWSGARRSSHRGRLPLPRDSVCDRRDSHRPDRATVFSSRLSMLLLREVTITISEARWLSSRAMASVSVEASFELRYKCEEGCCFRTDFINSGYGCL